MHEPSAKLKQALSQVHTSWDAARTERTLRAIPARRRQRRLRRVLGGTLAAGVALGCALWLMLASEPASVARSTRAPTGESPVHAPTSPSPPAARAPANASAAAVGRQLQLPDDSRIDLLDAPTDVVVEESSPALMALRLSSGRARFEVSPRPERLFRVRTAQVAVEVLGTVFELTQAGDKTRVRVEQGRVLVLWQDERALLTAGEQGWFPPAAREVADPQSAPPGKLKRSARGSAPRGPAQAAEGGWRELAEQGDFNTAFPLLPRVDTLASMPVSELLLAADAARLSGHPKHAIPFLARVVEAHPDDARAPLAAFTLGGLLMHQLGMPREAEAAYAKARAFRRGGALAQDALARQVEAAHRAGDDARARQLASEYLRQYPEGRRVHAVRRFGGL